MVVRYRGGPLHGKRHEWSVARSRYDCPEHGGVYIRLGHRAFWRYHAHRERVLTGLTVLAFELLTIAVLVTIAGLL